MKKTLMIAAGIFAVCGFLASCSSKDDNKIINSGSNQDIIGAWQGSIEHKTKVTLPTSPTTTIDKLNFNDQQVLTLNFDYTFSEKHYDIAISTTIPWEDMTGTYTYAGDTLTLTYTHQWNYTPYSDSYNYTLPLNCQISGNSMTLSSNTGSMTFTKIISG